MNGQILSLSSLDRIFSLSSENPFFICNNVTQHMGKLRGNFIC
jgi:hypothetical protein